MCFLVVSDILMTAKDGWIICPICHKKLGRTTTESEAHNLLIWCQRCRTEVTVEICKRDRSA